MRLAAARVHAGARERLAALLAGGLDDQLIASRPWKGEPFELRLKGLSRPFRLLRLLPR